MNISVHINVIVSYYEKKVKTKRTEKKHKIAFVGNVLKVKDKHDS